MQILEHNTHFLVHWSQDDHHVIYGVFSSVEIAWSYIENEPIEKRAELFHLYQIDEMKGTEVIDTIEVRDIFRDCDEVEEYLEKVGA